MLLLFSISANIILVVGLGIAAVHLQRERELRKQRSLFGKWPIRRVSPEIVDPIFATGRLGPDRKTEIRSIGSYGVTAGITDFETWIICNLARNAKSIFELGTCTGKTTYLLAANATEATVTTLTLHPDDLGASEGLVDDDPASVSAARALSKFATFFYQGTKEEERIVQLFGDSKNFDTAQFTASMDLVFVDGSHARSYVESDSEKALKMVKPGGIVLWHDYRGPRADRRTRGVFAALNDLSNRIELMHIADTSFVAYRAPLETV